MYINRSLFSRLLSINKIKTPEYQNEPCRNMEIRYHRLYLWLLWKYLVTSWTQRLMQVWSGYTQRERIREYRIYICEWCNDTLWWEDVLIELYLKYTGEVSKIIRAGYEQAKTSFIYCRFELFGNHLDFFIWLPKRFTIFQVSRTASYAQETQDL